MSACRRRMFALLIFIMLSFAGCAAFRGVDLRGYPDEQRTLFLHNFTNDSFQADVNVELTESLRREIARRENFRLMPDREGARLWVYGEITMYRRAGRMFDNLRTPTRLELLVAVRIKVRENPGENLWVSREVSARTEFSNREGFLETEFEARQRLLFTLARRANAVLESEFVSRAPAIADSP